jgi:RNA 2',3'-cyclic 3'-phosphodiesterase
MNEKTLLRLFIAVPICRELKKKFSCLTSELRKTGADVKWVEEANLHLTLKFLGETPESKVELIKDACRKALSSVPACTLAFKGLGTFPEKGSPRVYWVDVKLGGAEMSKMAENIEAALEPLGFPREKRKFTPHLTIGRTRSPKNQAVIKEVVAKNSGFEAGSMLLSEIPLFKSELTRQGPIYTAIEKFPLLS